MILDKNARLFNIVDFDNFGVNPTENSLDFREFIFSQRYNVVAAHRKISVH